MATTINFATETNSPVVLIGNTGSKKLRRQGERKRHRERETKRGGTKEVIII